jgi:hypothetical protein
MACVKPVIIGEEFEHIPPHITILPPFWMNPTQKNDFDRLISSGAEEYLPLTGWAEEPVCLGNNNELKYLPLSLLAKLPDYSDGKGLKVMPVSSVHRGLFACAVISGDRLGIEFDRKYSMDYKSVTKKIVTVSSDQDAVTVENDEVEEIVCTNINQTHITDFENIEVGSRIVIPEIQLFCYGALKKVVSIYSEDKYAVEV